MTTLNLSQKFKMHNIKKSTNVIYHINKVNIGMIDDRQMTDDKIDRQIDRHMIGRIFSRNAEKSLENI